MTYVPTRLEKIQAYARRAMKDVINGVDIVVENADKTTYVVNITKMLREASVVTQKEIK